MKYKVIFSDSALKQLKKIDRYQRRMLYGWVVKNLDGCENPRRIGKALSGNLERYWRYRVGGYRILAEIRDRELVISLVEIGHRRKVYR